MSLHLASLHVYPIKGAAGLTPREWEVDQRGLRYDRRWMLVEPSGGFLTQRELPELALVRPRIEPPHLVVEAPGMSELRLPLQPLGGRRLTVRVWNDRVGALLTDQKADQWFTDYLGLPAGLAWLPDDTIRPADPDYAPPSSQVSFADAFPFLVISQGSLDDLNSRLAVPLPMNRFRPNLVVAGGGPFAEDGWRRIRIGALELDVVKPCARCVVTTTDQLTAERGVEPLRTLATYRKIDGKVMFGQNALHDRPGRLTQGDLVTVLQSIAEVDAVATRGDDR
jgi:uncharacterized protein YcbX